MTDIIPYEEVQRELKPEQLRYAFLKANTTLSQRDIAIQLGVHYNTITNWNKNELVQQAIQHEVEVVKKDNGLKIQQLMQSMLKESIKMLTDEETPLGVKAQVIGQLFTSVGKYAGLEPTKKVEKNVNITKSFEQLMMDSDVEEAEVIECQD